MAEKMKEFDFGRLKYRNGSAYDEYLEIPKGKAVGSIWKLSVEDSSTGTASIRSMQTSIANTAKRKGLRIRSNVVSEVINPADPKDKHITQDFLVLQAYIPDTDEEDEE